MAKLSFTEVINQATRGDDAAVADVFDQVHQELRAVAQRLVVGERGDVQATMLVHEAYLKLFENKTPSWENRRHFFGAATQAMRRLLIDMARSRSAQKRGGGKQPHSLIGNVQDDPQAVDIDDLLDLDDAIQKLEVEDQQLAEIVKLRFYTGLPMGDISQHLDCSLSTVERKWRLARAFLIDKLTGSEARDPRDSASSFT